MIATYPLPVYVQRFFTERLLTQMQASPNTIASYRDTFRLLLRYAEAQTRLPPTELHVAHIDADIIGRFLTFCEEERGNSARSRNTRLAAIRSFFKYVAGCEPQLLHHCQKVLAMPSKRHEKRVVDFLTRDEMEALLKAPDQSTWFGRRDRVLLLTMLQTGLRVSELIGLRVRDVELGTGPHLRCMGKGRKERATPLRADSRDALRSWLAQIEFSLMFGPRIRGVGMRWSISFWGVAVLVGLAMFGAVCSMQHTVCSIMCITYRCMDTLFWNVCPKPETQFNLHIFVGIDTH